MWRGKLLLLCKMTCQPGPIPPLNLVDARPTYLAKTTFVIFHL